MIVDDKNCGTFYAYNHILKNHSGFLNLKQISLKIQPHQEQASGSG